MKTIAKKVAEIRKRKEMSLTEVAKLSGVDRTTIWKIERSSHVGVPPFETLQKVCLQGLGATEEEWEDIQSLWMLEHLGASELQKNKVTRQLLKASFLKEKEFDQFVFNFTNLSDQQRGAIIKAVERPAVIDGIEVLNTIYEEGSKRITPSQPE